MGTILLIAGLHFPALVLHWYYFIWWYDVLLHGLGGFAMGILGVMVWKWTMRNVDISARILFARLVFVLGFVALVGIGWEWFEALVDAVVLPAVQGMDVAQLGLVDTMLDLFFDLFGGLLAWACFLPGARKMKV